MSGASGRIQPSLKQAMTTGKDREPKGLGDVFHRFFIITRNISSMLNSFFFFAKYITNIFMPYHTPVSHI